MKIDQQIIDNLVKLLVDGEWQLKSSRTHPTLRSFYFVEKSTGLNVAFYVECYNAVDSLDFTGAEVYIEGFEVENAPAEAIKFFKDFVNKFIEEEKLRREEERRKKFMARIAGKLFKI